MDANAQRLSGLPLAELLERLGTSPRGLTSEEARQRLGRFGPNEPAATTRREAAVVQVLRRFANSSSRWPWPWGSRPSSCR